MDKTSDSIHSFDRMRGATLPDDVHTLVNLNARLKKKILQEKRIHEIVDEPSPQGRQRGRSGVSERGGSVAHYAKNTLVPPRKGV